MLGVFDPDRTLLDGYAKQYKLPESVLFTDLAAMLTKTSPEAVATQFDDLIHNLTSSDGMPREAEQ